MGGAGSAVLETSLEQLGAWSDSSLIIFAGDPSPSLSGSPDRVKKIVKTTSQLN